MTEREYDVWHEANVESFALAIGPARNLEPEAALDHAREQLETLLPKGLATPDQLLWTALHEGEAVGTLWISMKNAAPFVFGVEVDEEHRGQGFGRSIMLAAEDECRQRGYDRLELNVFGNNSTAIGLYASLGYFVLSQQMRKQL